MSPLRFRAWDEEQNRWRYPDDSDKPHYFWQWWYKTNVGGEPRPLQSTGLHDKNGKEIFEGDVVRTEFGDFEVYWRQECCGWYIRKPDGHIEFLATWLGNVHTLEVIGNIYENPELLPKAA